MKKKLHIFIWVVTLLCASCSINGSLQGLFSYYNKTKNESEIIFKPFNSVEDCLSLHSDSASVLIANGIQIRNSLSDIPKAVVYIWSPRCQGKYCYSLNVLQEICRQEECELFIVAEYFDKFQMSRYYHISHPIIGIDVEYYRTNFTSKYLSEFILDLTNGMYDYDMKNDNYCNFLSFKNGEFKRAFMSVEEL